MTDELVVKIGLMPSFFIIALFEAFFFRGELCCFIGIPVTFWPLGGSFDLLPESLAGTKA